jgi:pSer/pThr/pTyr-binding forkhead associated (FHA) protein
VTPPPLVTSARLVAGDSTSYVLSGKTTYLIGREDAVSGIFPDVDTTGSGGIDAGVSRRHAEIIQQGAQWFVQDLNSVNGTFVNNQRLASNTRQVLTPGSQIRLGRWIATFQV